MISPHKLWKIKKNRTFAIALRRSLHIAKYRNEPKFARFHIVTYLEWVILQLLDIQ